MPDFTIRKYDSNDLDQVINLIRLNTPEFFSAKEEPDLFNYLQNETDNYFIVETAGKITGSGGFNFRHSPTVAVIAWDIIHPEFHGTGQGSALVLHRLKLIRGLPEVKEVCVRTSQLAYRFYEKSGFVLREVIKNYWDEGFDLYRMDAKLNELNFMLKGS